MAQFGNWQRFLDKSLKFCQERDAIYNAFRDLKSNEDRIIFVEDMKFLEKTKWINNYFDKLKTVPSMKSHDTSAQLRLAGNKCYLKKQYVDALRLYTECIVLAPRTEGCTSELALGYGNRSALFYQTEEYENCLSDAKRALDHGYPKELQYRLHQRSGQSYIHLGKMGLAETELKVAKEMIYQLGDSVSQKIVKLVKEIDILIESAQQSSDKHISSVHKNAEEQYTLPPPVYGFGTTLLQASSAVDMLYSKDKGRHLVANRPIAAGDVVIVERPYAGVLLPTHYDSRCLHCLTKLRAAVPCHQCCTVQYCSEACRCASWNTYHGTECLIDHLLQSIGVAHLCLRLVLVTGLPQLLELKDDLKLRASSVISCEMNPVVKSTYACNYENVYQLMPHTEDMQWEDLLQYALTASLLLKCLDTSGFFKSINSFDDLKSVRSFVGGLLLRHVCQLVCNAHAITDCELTQLSATSLVDTVSQVRVATAIYPTASLMNHSCDPTIISSFHNDTLIVRVTKDVAPGEEIFNCYGPHCKRMGWRERQKHLREQYFFTCSCTACVKENKLDLCFKALKCPHCEGPLVSSTVNSSCMDCGRDVADTSSQKRAVLESDQLFIRGLQHLQNNSIDDALQLFQKCLDLRHSNVYKHNKDLSEVEDALARCHASKGNFMLAERLLYQSVNTTEVIYGDTSIELANELQKYAEVCYQAQERADALKAVERAIKIFKINYGQDCTQIKELNEFKQYLAT